MIQNAKDKGMTGMVAGLPDVSAGVLSFLQAVRIAFTQTQMVEGYAKDIKKFVNTMASVQPMAENLVVRKEGERSWKWSVVHMAEDLGLKNDDVFELGCVGYRIMQKNDWKQYGYVEFHVIEDYRTSNEN